MTTNNLNIVIYKVIYLYKFVVFWQFFVVKKLSDVVNITILYIYIYILGIHNVSLNIFSGSIYIIRLFYAKHFLIHYFSKLTFFWYGGINISRTAHPINLKFSGNVHYIYEGAMNQNDVDSDSDYLLCNKLTSLEVSL